ncbi:MAG: GGDEF domain-containing protein [Pseudomonadota bacterium]
MEQIGTFGASTYLLSDLQLFRDCAEPSLAAALAHCAIVRIPQGQQVADSTRARLYIVLRGALAVAADTRTGMADGTVSRVLAGESVGEQSVLDDATNLAAITATDDTELLVIEADLVWSLIDDFNGVARNLLRMLSFRIRAANALLRRRQKLGEFYRQLSMNDGLTGLYNRAWLGDVLPNLVSDSHASGRPLALVMIDLDHFKKFNDTHGHLGGDDALRAAAGVLAKALRPSDYAVRYGGEEMMVILPDTSEAVALMVAERLCQRVRDAVIFDDMRVPMPQLTASFGVALLVNGGDENLLIAHADAALYRAKEGGRNRVSV